MAHRRRAPYEDQSARTSILAGAVAPRPDTLMQTCQIASQNPLRTGRAIRFFEAILGLLIALRVRRARLLAREPHAAQHPGHARRVISLAEMSGHPAAQIAARPGATTVAVGLGPRRITAASAASSPSVNRRCGRPLGRSRSPAKSSVL